MDNTNQNVYQPQTLPIQTQNTAKPNDMKLPLIVLAVVALLSLSGNGYFLYQQQNIAKETEMLRTNQVAHPQYYFMSPNNPDLSEYGVYYNFKTKVEDIVRTPEGFKLKVAYKGSSLPLGSKTLYFYDSKKDGASRTDRSSLKKGQDISAMLSFDENTKLWTTRGVTILVDSLPDNTATSSAINN